MGGWTLYLKPKWHSCFTKNLNPTDKKFIEKTKCIPTNIILEMDPYINTKLFNLMQYVPPLYIQNIHHELIRPLLHVNFTFASQ